MNQIIDYLENTIGLDVVVLGNSNIPTGKLPFHLNQANEFHIVEINGRALVFVKPKHREYPTPDQIKMQLEQIKKAFQLPSVYVFDKVDTYTRKRLVHNRTAFIVLNRQMYIPYMLIDLDEVKMSKEDRGYLSPAAQCILIYHLMVKPLNDHNLKAIAETLTYSQMTITRAVRELEGFGFCEGGRAKDKRVWFNQSGKELWEATKKKMKNPVKKKVWLEDLTWNQNLTYSGISALARYTNLSEDRWPTFAIKTDLYKQLKRDNVLFGENKKYGQVALEIWKYDPEILALNDKVDPLSLYLTLEKDEDERVQQALEKMIDEIW